MSAPVTVPPDLVGRRRSLHWDASAGRLWILDQTRLPHEVQVLSLADLDAVVEAIREMRVRGAPLIGVTAAYGLALQARTDAGEEAMEAASQALLGSRPTAVNLGWAVRRMREVAARAPIPERARILSTEARAIEGEETERSRRMGEHGLRHLVGAGLSRLDSARPLQILTHCNTGWLATTGTGTALAVIYEAQAQGTPIHVWVDETRPRAQGAKLTAWELHQAGVACTLLPDVGAATLLRAGRVDAVLVGCDRATANGDVCNKIGTYPLALAARDNGVPFYAVLPASSVDWTLADGDAVPIEERAGEEVTELEGLDPDGRRVRVRLAPAGIDTINFAFDLTPAHLLTGLVTEHGVFPASTEGVARLREKETAERTT